MPHLAGVTDPELWFSKRGIQFIKKALIINSGNIIVRTINNVGLNVTQSIMVVKYETTMIDCIEIQSIMVHTVKD